MVVAQVTDVSEYFIPVEHSDGLITEGMILSVTYCVFHYIYRYYYFVNEVHCLFIVVIFTPYYQTSSFLPSYRPQQSQLS